MKEDKAAAAPTSRARMKIMKGEAKGGSSLEQTRKRSRRETNEGDKATAAGKSRPEWRSCRKTSKGRQGGSATTIQRFCFFLFRRARQVNRSRQNTVDKVTRCKSRQK